MASYEKYRMDYKEVPSLLSSFQRAKKYTRPPFKETLFSGLGTVIDVLNELDEDRNLEMVDQKRLDRSIELGKMRVQAREYEELRDQYEPIAKQFEINALDIDDTDARDSIVGKRIWEKVRKASPDFFAAHPNLTFEQFQKRKSLVPAQEDNSFWNLTNDLYTSMRDNYIEKVKMSQKFDSDEFNRSAAEADKMIKSLGANVLRGSNYLSKVTGSDIRRINLADSLIQSRMANMLNRPIIDAQKDYEAWKATGKELNLTELRKETGEAKLSYFNYLPESSLVPFKNTPTVLADIQINGMRQSIVNHQKANNGEMPSQSQIIDMWNLNTLGTLNQTAGQQILKSNLDSEVSRIIDEGGENVEGRVLAAYEEYKDELKDYSSLTATVANQRIVNVKSLRDYDAYLKSKTTPPTQAELEHRQTLQVLVDTAGQPAIVATNRINQMKAKNYIELVNALPKGTELTNESIGDTNGINQDTKNTLFNSEKPLYEIKAMPSNINSPVSINMLKSTSDYLKRQAASNTISDGDAAVFEHIIEGLDNNEAAHSLEARNSVLFTYHTLIDLVESNKHSSRMGVRNDNLPLGAYINSDNPIILQTLAEYLKNNTREIGSGDLSGTFTYEIPTRKELQNSLRKRLANTDVNYTNVSNNIQVDAKNKDSRFNPNSALALITKDSSTEEKNAAIAVINQDIQKAQEEGKSAVVDVITATVNKNLEGLEIDQETGLYMPLNSVSSDNTVEHSKNIIDFIGPALERALSSSSSINKLEGSDNPFVESSDNPYGTSVDAAIKISKAVKLQREIATIYNSIAKGSEYVTKGVNAPKVLLEEKLAEFKELVHDPYVKELLKKQEGDRRIAYLKYNGKQIGPSIDIADPDRPKGEGTLLNWLNQTDVSLDAFMDATTGIFGGGPDTWKEPSYIGMMEARLAKREEEERLTKERRMANMSIDDTSFKGYTSPVKATRKLSDIDLGKLIKDDSEEIEEEIDSEGRTFTPPARATRKLSDIDFGPLMSKIVDDVISLFVPSAEASPSILSKEQTPVAEENLEYVGDIKPVLSSISNAVKSGELKNDLEAQAYAILAAHTNEGTIRGISNVAPILDDKGRQVNEVFTGDLLDEEPDTTTKKGIQRILKARIKDLNKDTEGFNKDKLLSIYKKALELTNKGFNVNRWHNKRNK